MKKDYSVIVPVYNSERSLNELTERLKNVFLKLNKSVEIIFVDDYSTDDSWTVLKSIKAENPGLVSCIRLSQNYGQHKATLCGFQHSDANFIITIDDDLQHPPEEISKLISEMESSGSDVVYGIADNKHPVVRKTGSRFFKYFSGKLKLGYGKGSAFRLMHAALAQRISEQLSYSVFIEQLLYRNAANVSYVQVSHHARKYGSSSYSAKTILALTVKLILFNALSSKIFKQQNRQQHFLISELA